MFKKNLLLLICASFFATSSFASNVFLNNDANQNLNKDGVEHIRFINGKMYYFFTQFKVDEQLFDVFSDEYPKNAIGIYSGKVVYSSDKKVSDERVLAFVRPGITRNGALLLKDINFKCVFSKPLCNPLESLNVEIQHIDPTQGYSRVMVKDLDMWLQVYDILKKHKDIIEVLPIIDNGNYLIQYSKD